MQISKLIYSKLCAKRNQNKKHTLTHTNEVRPNLWKKLENNKSERSE